MPTTPPLDPALPAMLRAWTAEFLGGLRPPHTELTIPEGVTQALYATGNGPNVASALQVRDWHKPAEDAVNAAVPKLRQLRLTQVPGSEREFFFGPPDAPIPSRLRRPTSAYPWQKSPVDITVFAYFQGAFLGSTLNYLSQIRSLPELRPIIDALVDGVAYGTGPQSVTIELKGPYFVRRPGAPALPPSPTRWVELITICQKGGFGESPPSLPMRMQWRAVLGGLCLFYALSPASLAAKPDSLSSGLPGRSAASPRSAGHSVLSGLMRCFRP